MKTLLIAVALTLVASTSFARETRGSSRASTPSHGTMQRVSHEKTSTLARTARSTSRSSAATPAVAAAHAAPKGMHFLPTKSPGASKGPNNMRQQMQDAR